MKRYIIGGLIAVGLVVVMGSGYQPRDTNGGIVSDFAPRKYIHYSSTKVDYTYNVSNVAKFKVKPTAATNMYLGSATGVPKALAANTEYGPVGVGVDAIVFDIASSATKTKIWIEEQ